VLAWFASEESSLVHFRMSFKGKFPHCGYYKSDIRPILSSTNTYYDMNSLGHGGSGIGLQ